jgi:thymidylate kinase
MHHAPFGPPPSPYRHNPGRAWPAMATARPAPRIVALEGTSGVGKSRIARALTSGSPGMVLLKEAYERIRPTPSLAVPDAPSLLRVEQRLVREEQRRFREAVEARRRGSTVVADTGFLGPLTYSVGLAAIDPGRDVVAPIRTLYLDAAAGRRIGLPDLTLLLDASASTVRRRLAGDATRHPVAWRARHAAVGRIEARLWTGPLARRLGPRFQRISAAGTPERVAARIRRILMELPGPPALSEQDAARRLHGTVRDAVPGKS